MEYQRKAVQSKRNDLRDKVTQESLRADLFETNIRNTIAVFMNSKDYELEAKKESLQVILDKLKANKADLDERFYEDTLDDVRTKMARNDLEITRKIVSQNRKKNALAEAPKGLLKDIYSFWKENSIFNPIDTSINLVKGVLYTIPKNLFNNIATTDGKPETIKKKINDLLATKDKLYSIIRHAENMEDINLKNETFALLKSINQEVEALELSLFSQGFERATKKKKKYKEPKDVKAKKKVNTYEFSEDDDFDDKIRKSNNPRNAEKVKSKSEQINEVHVKGVDDVFSEKVIETLKSYDFDEVKYIQKLAKRLSNVELLERGDDIKVIPVGGGPDIDLDPDGKRKKPSKWDRFKRAVRSGANSGKNVLLENANKIKNVGSRAVTGAVRGIKPGVPQVVAATAAAGIAYEFYDEIEDVVLDVIENSPTIGKTITIKVAEVVGDTINSKEFVDFIKATKDTISTESEAIKKATLTEFEKAKKSVTSFLSESKNDFQKWFDTHEFNPVKAISGITKSTHNNANNTQDVKLVDVYKPITQGLSLTSKTLKRDVSVAIASMQDGEITQMRNQYIVLSGVKDGEDGFTKLDSDFKKRVVIFAKLYHEKYNEQLIFTSGWRSITNTRRLQAIWDKGKGNLKDPNIMKERLQIRPVDGSDHLKGLAMDVSKNCWTKSGFDSLLAQSGTKLYRPLKVKGAKLYDPVHIIGPKSSKKPDAESKDLVVKIPPLETKDTKTPVISNIKKNESSSIDNYYKKLKTGFEQNEKKDLLVNPSFEHSSRQTELEKELTNKRTEEDAKRARELHLVSLREEIKKRSPNLDKEDIDKIANEDVKNETKLGGIFINIKKDLLESNPDKPYKEISDTSINLFNNANKLLAEDKIDLELFETTRVNNWEAIKKTVGSSDSDNITKEVVNIVTRERRDKNLDSKKIHTDSANIINQGVYNKDSDGNYTSQLNTLEYNRDSLRGKDFESSENKESTTLKYIKLDISAKYNKMTALELEQTGAEVMVIAKELSDRDKISLETFSLAYKDEIRNDKSNRTQLEIAQDVARKLRADDQARRFKAVKTEPQQITFELADGYGDNSNNVGIATQMERDDVVEVDKLESEVKLTNNNKNMISEQTTTQKKKKKPKNQKTSDTNIIVNSQEAPKKEPKKDNKPKNNVVTPPIPNKSKRVISQNIGGK